MGVHQPQVFDDGEHRDERHLPGYHQWGKIDHEQLVAPRKMLFCKAVGGHGAHDAVEHARAACDDDAVQQLSLIHI